MTAEVLNNQNQRKFIPILRQPDWSESAPSWLSGKCFIDLSASPYSETHYQDLLTTLLGTRQKPPPVGSSSELDAQTNSNSRIMLERNEITSESIKILGMIVDQIGEPRDDGTCGSALYRVPFRLSRRPTREWADLFLQSWNRPPTSTSMHRSGIASVVNDTVILDGTTVEEVEMYHRDTLILATQEANDKYHEFIEKKQLEEDRERSRLEAHKRKVEDVSKRISFDEE